MAAKFGLLIDAKTKGENNIKRLGNSMQGVEGKAKNLGMAVRGVGSAFKALFAAAAVAGFSAFVKGAIDSADAFGKLSTRTGIAADKLQAFANAGKLADVSQSDLEAGLRTFARTQSEAADGVATYADAYEKLGLSVKKADGSLKPSDRLLGEIADKFKDLPNGPEKAAVAMDIFGRSGSKLITLLNGGTEALEKFNYETSENFAQNAEFFNDQITTIAIKFDGFRNQLADALLPTLNTLVKVFNDLLISGQDFGPLFKTVDVVIRGVAFAVLGVVKAIDELVRLLGAAFRMVNAYRKLDFKEVAQISADFRSGFVERLGVSSKQFQEIMFGTSEVGTDYGGAGGGQFDRLDPSDRGKGARQKAGRTQKEIVKMTQQEFDLRQAIRDAKDQENEIALINSTFALEQFKIGSKFNGDVLGARDALLDAELAKNLALRGIEEERAEAARQAAEEARAAAQARLEADPGYQMKQQLEELLDVQNQAAAGATAIGNAFSNAFTSIINGTKSADQAIADMLSSVAEHFMDMAAQIIAKQLAMIAYGLIMKALGVNAGGDSASVPFDTSTPLPGGMTYGSLAEGGYVSGPTRALIGEGGESEYVIPESKMRESMARYSRGARGSAVIPEAGASGTSGEGGGTAVVAPIDVRYTVERINSVDYVTADQFQRGMQQAASQGAKQGEQQTLKRLQMSGSTRKRLGM